MAGESPGRAHGSDSCRSETELALAFLLVPAAYGVLWWAFHSDSGPLQEVYTAEWSGGIIPFFFAPVSMAVALRFGWLAAARARSGHHRGVQISR